MIIKHQKYLIGFLLFIINTLLSSLFIIYPNYWYIFLIILCLDSIVNTSSSIILFIKRMFIKNKNKNKNIRIHPKNYLYVIPCYNESEEELRNTFNSITLQRTVKNDKRLMFIVCDGIVRGKHKSEKNDIILKNILDVNNCEGETTDIILKKILNVKDFGEIYEYTTWDGTKNTIKIYKGIYKYLVDDINFRGIYNYGKPVPLGRREDWCIETISREQPDCRTDIESITFLNGIILIRKR